ncbi:MAG: DUF308 domain-containing protein [Anaerolineae bacterium]|nr:DUF308 domain-containing protein [Anaerolineae bacterium]
MSDQNPTSAWPTNLVSAICEHCDWRYLLPSDSLPAHQLARCPHCFQATLVTLDQPGENLPYPQPPELILPFTLSVDQLAANIQQFAGRIWFAPRDLTPQNLRERLQRVYLPMWLVDSEVQATWQAEVGFNYQVVSHQDRFDENRGGWVSQEITETRIRWEPRLGRLTRTYHNIAAPALEEHHQLQQKLGPANLEAAQAYQSESITNAFIRLPNRLQTDAWPDAIPPLQATAAEECRQASRADHLRQFRWKAEYSNLNWTLLLLPIYTTYYLDDNQNPQPILLHGQSGRLSGPRRASMKRAQQTALIIVSVATVVFVISLILGAVALVRPPVLAVAIIALVVALIIGLLAIAPIVIAWQFNRSNPSSF